MIFRIGNKAQLQMMDSPVLFIVAERNDEKSGKRFVTCRWVSKEHVLQETEFPDDVLKEVEP